MRIRRGTILRAVLALGLTQAGCGGTAPRSPAEADAAPAPAGLDGPRIRVLGTVQDGGLPHAACDCVRCAAARTRPDRARRVASLAVLIPSARAAYLIDATPDIREQLHDLREFRSETAGGFDRSPVAGVLLTHAHVGHYLGLAFFGFEAIHSRDLPVYCSASLAGYLRENGPWSQLVRIGNIELREIADGGTLELGEGVAVTPVTVPHRDEYADTLGFVIRGGRSTVLYVPDTDNWWAWDPPLEDALAGIDVAILDGTFFSGNEMPGRDVASIGHPMIRDSMDRLEARVAAGKLRVLFTHLNHSNPALDPDGPEAIEVRRRGFEILAERQEFPL